MAQRILLYMPSDVEVINESPLTIVDTLYYELWYRVTGSQNWNQQIYYSPLPLETLLSPAGEMPVIIVSPLPDQTEYEYKVRRFNSDNVPSDWFEGTFTTGS